MAFVLPAGPSLRALQGLSGLGATAVSLADGLAALPVKPSLTLKAAWSGWQQRADGAVMAVGPDGRTRTIINVAGQFVTASGALADLGAALGPAVASLSSFSALSKVAAFAGPYGAAVAAAAPVLEMAFKAFAGSKARPLPSLAGINAAEFNVGSFLDDDRKAELVGRLVRDQRAVSGKNEADRETAASNARDRLSRVVEVVINDALRLKRIDPSEHRALCIALAQLKPKTAAKWIDKRGLPYLMALIEYGTPRAALRDALAMLGVLLSAEASEAWTVGDRDGDVYRARRPPGRRDCKRPGLRLLSNGMERALPFVFQGRFTGWAGIAGRTSGHDARQLCDQGVELYASVLANRMLPRVVQPDEGKHGPTATGRAEVVYPIPEDVAREEIGYYQRRAARIYTVVAGSEFVFGFPAGDRSAGRSEREPDIDNDTVRPLPSAPEAIRLIFRVAKTAPNPDLPGKTWWQLANDAVRAEEKRRQDTVEAEEKRLRATVGIFAGIGERLRAQREAKAARGRLIASTAAAVGAGRLLDRSAKKAAGAGLSPVAKALIAAAGAAALFG